MSDSMQEIETVLRYQSLATTRGVSEGKKYKALIADLLKIVKDGESGNASKSMLQEHRLGRPY
jgi:hypothetical protein